MRPFFSIGVTTYNRQEMLKECLSSIIGQTFSDFEVIVGNDYTLDTLSAELLGIDDPRLRFVNHPQNLGELGNSKFLLEMSQGRYFTWLADDDMYAPTFLEAVHTAIAEFYSPSCVFTSFKSGTTFYCEIEDSLRHGQLFEGSQFVQLYLSRKLKAIGCYGVFEREYIKQTGGMEQLGEGFSPYSDNLLAIKAGSAGKVAYIDAPLMFFRKHEESMSAVSTDVDAYSSAQICLLDKCVKILMGDSLKQDFQSNFNMLLAWCINDFLSVSILRSERVSWKKLINHLISIRGYTKLLGGYHRKIPIVHLYAGGRWVIKLVRSRIMQGLARVRQKF